jgi:hypothetical protein
MFLQPPGGRTIKLGRGAVTTACFAIISRGNDVQQVASRATTYLDLKMSKMTIGKGPFQIEVH